MRLIDQICYEYRGRLSVVEAMNMNIGDLIILKDFIIKRREAADAEKNKEKQTSEAERMKALRAAYRGHPQGGIMGTKDQPKSYTREEMDRFTDELEGFI